MLLDIAPGKRLVAYPEQLSSLINLSKNCSEEAMSPPDILIPVAALTATSTTHVTGLPPASPAPASSLLVSVPIVPPKPQSTALAPFPKGPDISLGNTPGSSSMPDLPISSTKALDRIDLSPTTVNAVHTPITQDKPEGGVPVPQITPESAPTITPQAAPGDVDKNLQPTLRSVAKNVPQMFPEITIASQTYQPTAFPVITLSGSAVLPSVPTTISGTPIALQPGGSSLIIGSNTVPIPTPGKILTLGSNTITADSASVFILDGQTAVPGSPAITVSGTTISINPEASNAVINGITTPLSPAASTVVVGGYTITPGLASGYNIGGSSALVAGGQAVTVIGIPYSLAPGGTALVVAGSSTQILSPTPLSVSPTAKLITFAGSTYTPNSASQYIIGSETLEPGSAITVAGTPISLAADGTRLVVAGSSTQILSPTPLPTSPIAAKLLTFAGSTYTPNSASQYIIGSQTLEPGSAITISGTPISLAPGATQAVIGTSTELLAQQSSPPLASVIMAGFGSPASGGNNGSSGSGNGKGSVVVFTGMGGYKSIAQRLATCVFGVVVGEGVVML